MVPATSDHRAPPEGDLGEDPQHLAAVLRQRLRDAGQAAAVERDLVAEVATGSCRCSSTPDARQAHHRPFGGTSW